MLAGLQQKGLYRSRSMAWGRRRLRKSRGCQTRLWARRQFGGLRRCRPRPPLHAYAFSGRINPTVQLHAMSWAYALRRTLSTRSSTGRRAGRRPMLPLRPR